MENNQEKKVLLALRHVDVDFNVRGRTLSAIRDVTLNIYDGESIAIVGESGSGKSVLTKTFAGMLDDNGTVSHGSIVFSDEELSRTTLKWNPINKFFYHIAKKSLTHSAYLGAGSEQFNKIGEIKSKMVAKESLSEEEVEEFKNRIKDAEYDLIDSHNFLISLNKKNKEDAELYKQTTEKIAQQEAALEAIKQEQQDLINQRIADFKSDVAAIEKAKADIAELKVKRIVVIEDYKDKGLTKKDEELCDVIAKEIMLSIGRYPIKNKVIYFIKLLLGFKKAFIKGIDIATDKYRNRVFDKVVFRVIYKDTLEDGTLLGHAIVDCAKVKYTKDWQQIRGCKIATVFQDPMTSLNPIVTIGKQIMSVILKHQNCSYDEAKERALDMMEKVGIPDPKKRFNDYPFQYSGGMRQRIVIAIALSCRPKILICDEPTTALDVTIQAQILRLIKKLQQELGFTIVFITHDLGVVANIADRVAVLYGGQVQEIGTAEDIFFRPAHPYTWALLSSLPQLSERGKELFSIPGTPPSLYNKIVGDSFAPRNKYCMAIDLVKEPPMFQISETHFAKTWLLDPRSPKVEMPENIQNLHEKMMKTYVHIDSNQKEGK